MSKSDRIKDIVSDCQNALAMREWDRGQLGKIGTRRETINTESERDGRERGDEIVPDRGIGGVGTHPTPHTPSTQAPHIDNPPIDKSLKDFNDIAHRQASSIIHQPCPSCHGTGRMSIGIVNGIGLSGYGGTMPLAGTGQDIGNGLGAGKG